MFFNRLDRIEKQLNQIEENQKILMATAASILAQVQQEQADINSLSTLVGNLIAAFNAQAAGSLTPAQLSTLSAALTADDATVTSLNGTITNVLGSAAPVPATPATPATPVTSAASAATAAINKLG